MGFQNMQLVLKKCFHDNGLIEIQTAAILSQGVNMDSDSIKIRKVDLGIAWKDPTLSNPYPP